MSLRQQYAEFRSKVADRNNYPELPKRIKEKLLENLDAMLALEDGDKFEYKARWFRLGASRFILDSCSWETEELFEDMPHISPP